MKKGLKDFFFETRDVEDELYADAGGDFLDTEVEVETSEVTQDNLISDVYDANDLSDKTKSIFKVEEVLNSLPKEMPNETKKSTLLAILGSFGLTVEEVISDGESRISIINAALSKIRIENENVMNNNMQMIEQKKVEIQDLEKDNANRTEIITNTEYKISAEVDRLNALMTFVKGE